MGSARGIALGKSKTKKFIFSLELLPLQSFLILGKLATERAAIGHFMAA